MRAATPFNVLVATAPVVDVGPSLLLRLGAALLTGRRVPEGERAEALLHIPRGAGEEMRRQLGLEAALKPGELYAVEATAGGAFQVRPLGRLPRLDPLRHELLLLSLRSDSCAVIASRPGANREQPWSAVISGAPDDAGAAADALAALLDASVPAAASVAAKMSETLRNGSGGLGRARNRSLFGALVTEVSASLEQRSRRWERDIKWFRTITRIQDAVGWELDAGRLNGAVARVLKSSVGYDYLELQHLQPVGRKFEVVSTYQRNDTAFGGQLLTVILHPERQEELLHGHRPLLISQATASRLLMNPKLLSFMGLASGILVPLVHQRRPNALLKLLSRRAGQYGDNDLERMEAIGRVIAKSIENAKVHSAMRRMATVDGLTNVYNHRFFAEHFAREFKRAHRYNSSLSLLMLDIDYFKQFNDANGHLQGDYVLATVAKLLKSNVREVDLVCRYGGEEFAVILPETDVEQARVVADKIRRAIEEYPFKAEAKQPGGKLTISIGLAAGTTGIDSPNELVNRADVALYRAKKLGRNRCETF